jgi:hypothetical protein
MFAPARSSRHVPALGDASRRAVSRRAGRRACRPTIERRPGARRAGEHRRARPASAAPAASGRPSLPAARAGRPRAGSSRRSRARRSRRPPRRDSTPRPAGRLVPDWYLESSPAGVPTLEKPVIYRDSHGRQGPDQHMRRVGVEPTRPSGQGLLRAPRLPFRHRRIVLDASEDIWARPLRRAVAERRCRAPSQLMGRGAPAPRSSPGRSLARRRPRAAAGRARSAA